MAVKIQNTEWPTVQYAVKWVRICKIQNTEWPTVQYAVKWVRICKIQNTKYSQMAVKLQNAEYRMNS